MDNEELIDLYLRKILIKNQTVNLTNITDYETARILHVQDSLFALPEFSKAPKGKYADIGTGAGFPGVPLALISSRETVLIDSVGKKIRCIEEVLEELSIRSIHTYNGRIEDYARLHPSSFAVVTARALAQLSILMELSAPLLKPDGLLIAYKADIKDDEYQHALQVQKVLGMKIEQCRVDELEGRKRTIISIRKVSPPSIRLPRKVGFAQKRPL